MLKLACTIFGAIAVTSTTMAVNLDNLALSGSVMVCICEEVDKYGVVLGGFTEKSNAQTENCEVDFVQQLRNSKSNKTEGSTFVCTSVEKYIANGKKMPKYST